MHRSAIAILSLLAAAPAWTEYNYHRPTELLVTLGTQALMICNGRFVSNRPLDLIYEQELKLDRMPAPSTLDRGGFYGGHWWLVPDERKDIPSDTYTTAGNRGQHAVVVPSYDLVIVRRGLDWLPGDHSFPEWDLTREVLKAFPERTWGQKPQPTTDSQ
jgi:CubicO group peptidase (beta-lactamase class C family)